MVVTTIPRPRTWSVSPNLIDYEATRATFTWEAAAKELDGLPHGRGLNIAHEAVDRHALGPHRDRVAFRWLGKAGGQKDLTYGELRELTNRFANILRDLGVGKGERVFILAGRIPELYVSVLGALKNASVASPLFSAFGPEPIRQRLEIGDGRVLVTTEAIYRRKVASIRKSLPDLKHVLLVGENGTTDMPGTLDLRQLMAEASPEFEIPPTAPEDMALLHFTSGTTGTPKGAVHVHQADRKSVV
jgi:acetyl-CoA synthetase